MLFAKGTFFKMCCSFSAEWIVVMHVKLSLKKTKNLLIVFIVLSRLPVSWQAPPLFI